MRLAIMGLFLALSLPAMAEPTTIQEVMSEFRKRDATSMQGAILMGDPVITGSLEEQGFTATLLECEKPDYACRVVMLQTCRAVPLLGVDDALQIANSYNTGQAPRGFATVTREGVASLSLCVRSRSDMDADNYFNMGETFRWSRTMTEFLEFVDEATLDAQARSILK